MGNFDVKVFPRNAENISDVVDMFIDDDFFLLLVTETNKYYMHKYKKEKKYGAEAENWNQEIVMFKYINGTTRE